MLNMQPIHYGTSFLNELIPYQIAKKTGILADILKHAEKLQEVLERSQKTLQERQIQYPVTPSHDPEQILLYLFHAGVLTNQIPLIPSRKTPESLRIEQLEIQKLAEKLEKDPEIRVDSYFNASSFNKTLCRLFNETILKLTFDHDREKSYENLFEYFEHLLQVKAEEIKTNPTLRKEALLTKEILGSCFCFQKDFSPTFTSYFVGHIIGKDGQKFAISLKTMANCSFLTDIFEDKLEVLLPQISQNYLNIYLQFHENPLNEYYHPKILLPAISSCEQIGDHKLKEKLLDIFSSSMRNYSSKPITNYSIQNCLWLLRIAKEKTFIDFVNLHIAEKPLKTVDSFLKSLVKEMTETEKNQLSTLNFSKCIVSHELLNFLAEHFPFIENLILAGDHLTLSLPTITIPTAWKNTLKEIDAQNRKSLLYIENGDHLPHLKQINITGTSIERAPIGCSELEIFIGSKNNKLKYVFGLNHLRHLRFIDVSYTAIQMAPIGCQALEVFLANGSKNLYDISGLEDLEQLTDVNLLDTEAHAIYMGSNENQNTLINIQADPLSFLKNYYSTIIF